MNLMKHQTSADVTNAEATLKGRLIAKQQEKSV